MATTCDIRGEAIGRKRLVTGFAIIVTAFFAPRAMMADSVIAGGYTFTNFDFPNSGNNAGAGTNANGIANNGAAVGFSIDNNGAFTNFVRNPNGTFTNLNLGLTTDMAFGINSAGTVAGQQNNNAFILPAGGSPQPLINPTGASTAFGINDHGDVVGQYSSAGFTPGFLIVNGIQTTINAPSGPNIVNAQGINNNGLVVGFYIGTDGQDHGFNASAANANNGVLNGTPIADPKIPNVAGEPGATFVFSQILGVNDNGIEVGYYGDSTTSQHGFFYNPNTGTYTFLDDPSEQFNNGVEVTQITGINNAGEIAGFYSDAAGVFHGFVACPTGMTCANTAASPVPEPASGLLTILGLGALCLGYFKRSGRVA